MAAHVATIDAFILRPSLSEATHGGGQVPTASCTHFLAKLVFAAPASFFSPAWVVQEVVASLSHLVMKLLSAAPASFLSEAWALHVASCAKAVAANVESSAASNISFIGFSSDCVGESSPGRAWRRGGCIPEAMQKSSDPRAVDRRGVKGAAVRRWSWPGLSQACPGHPDDRALCHPDRDRRDKPGDDPGVLLLLRSIVRHHRAAPAAT